jgi:aminoglycoside phosphotransferase (APT) family kinase protein
MDKAEPEWYRDRLRADFPNLEPRGVKIIGDGWDHVALDANGIIFRIPKDTKHDPGREARIRTEVAVLKRLRGKLPVAIPDPQHIAPEAEYFGYPKLEGMTAYELRDQLTDGQRQEVDKRWVEVAAAIHGAIDPNEARQLGVRDIDPAPVIELARSIFKLRDVPQDFFDFARRALDQVSSIEFRSETYFFLHEDFHGKNMLLDYSTHIMTGLIDWSDMILAPLEQEFWVWEWSPDDGIDKAAARYQDLTNLSIDVASARTWCHLNEISDYVEQNESGDQLGAEDSARHIRRWISEGK